MSDNKKPIYKKWWFWVLTTPFFLFILVLIAPVPEIENDSPVAIEEIQEIDSELIIFNVPELVGSDIDEIRAILGDPSDGEYTDPSDIQLELGTTQWQNQFDRDGGMLLIDFNVETREIIDFFIAPKEATSDTDSIIALAGLSPNDPSYEFKPVKLIKDPKLFTGVVIRIK